MRSVSEVLADMRENERLMNGRLFEREEAVHGLQLSTICQKHVLLLGPPGTGKSLCCRTAAEQFHGAKHYEKMLSRQTEEATVVGYLNAKAYADTGQYVCNVEGTISDADFAFLDEVFRGNAGTRDGLLGIMNERLITLGPVKHKVPLIVLWGASNSAGDDDASAAFNDRLVFNYWVDAIQKPANKVRFLRERAAALNGNAPTYPALRQITLDELRSVQAAAAALPIDEQVFSILADLQKRLAGVGVTVSDRRIESCLSILQAEALLAGDSEVGPEHCEVLRHCLWNDPADRQNVASAVGNIDKGLIGEIRSIVENALSRYYSLRGGYDPATDTWTSDSARDTYRAECPELCAGIQATAQDIKARFGGGVPPRVVKRAKEYLDELRDAFVTARRDAQFALR